MSAHDAGPAGSASASAAAAAHAARAAHAAGVRIELAEDVPTLREVTGLFAYVWQTPPEREPLDTDVLRALVHAEGAVHVARDGTGVVGACAAIFTAPASRGAYSLIAAARTASQGVGFALKQAQRAWALEHGARSMTWTFDPLVSRNARINLVKLGAVAREYTVDFYGQMNNGIEGSGESDRLTAVWSLTGPRASAAAAGHYPDATGPDLASAETTRAPDGGPLTARDEGGRWCRVPMDIVAVRRRDPAVAAQWRAAVRDVFRPAFAEGFVAVSMSRDGWYRLTSEEPL